MAQWEVKGSTEFDLKDLQKHPMFIPGLVVAVIIVLVILYFVLF